jgi:four helix bundle protein
MAIDRHTQLDVHKIAFDAAMQVFRVSRQFTRDEIYSLTDQVRRCSRSVNANITEAWRKRRYESHFISKLSDAETEAAETQYWLQFAVECGYLDRAQGRELYKTYDRIIGMIVSMIKKPQPWLLPKPK